MSTDPAGLAARLDGIERTLAVLQRRVAALETTARTAAPEEPDAAGAGAAALVSPRAAGEARDLAGVLPHAGLAFIALGGAFLLRALTESDRLAVATGVALGLAYAAAWLAAAYYRAGSGSRRLAAAFHGLTAVGIGLPLLWEASSRFGLLAPGWSASAIGVFSGLALLVAWRRRLHGLAGVTTLATIGAALLLAGTLGGYVPYGALLVALGLATLWLGYECDWYWLRWPSALAADAVLAGLTTRALNPNAHQPTGEVLALLLFLLAGYLASFAVRTLVRGRLVIPFEVVQTLAVLAVGLGGGVAVAHATGAGEGPLGAATTMLGIGAYAAAFAFVGRRQGLGKNFYFYATLALLLTATGLAILLPAVPFALACGALAVATTWLAARLSRDTLALHGAVYAALAAGFTGLLGGSLSAFAASDTAGSALAPAAWAALAAAAAAFLLPRPSHADGPEGLSRTPRLALGLIVLAGAGAAALMLLVTAIAGGEPSPGLLAAARSAILAAAAVLLALATRHERLRDLGWWLYPVLAAGGLKLIVEDFRRSGPTALFVALALFGAALVAAPRLARRAGLGVPAAGAGGTVAG